MTKNEYIEFLEGLVELFERESDRTCNHLMYPFTVSFDISRTDDMDSKDLYYIRGLEARIEYFEYGEKIWKDTTFSSYWSPMRSRIVLRDEVRGITLTAKCKNETSLKNFFHIAFMKVTDYTIPVFLQEAVSFLFNLDREKTFESIEKLSEEITVSTRVWATLPTKPMNAEEYGTKVVSGVVDCIDRNEKKGDVYHISERYYDREYEAFSHELTIQEDNRYDIRRLPSWSKLTDTITLKLVIGREEKYE